MNVRPTNSGTIVQARAHVLIGSLEPVCCAAWTFLKTLKSTNGPFLLERLIRIRNATEGVPYSCVRWCSWCSLLKFQDAVAPAAAAADNGFVRGLAALTG